MNQTIKPLFNVTVEGSDKDNQCHIGWFSLRGDNKEQVKSRAMLFPVDRVDWEDLDVEVLSIDEVLNVKAEEDSE